MTRRFLSSAFLVFGFDQLGHVAGQLGLRQRDVAVIVECHPFQVFAGMNWARPSASTITPNSLPSFSRAIITSTIMSTIAIEVHDPPRAGRLGLGVGDGFGGLEITDQVFDAEDQARLAGDGRAIGQPACASAHGFDQEEHPAGLGVGEQVADLARQGFDRREVAEREVDARDSRCRSSWERGRP